MMKVIGDVYRQAESLASLMRWLSGDKPTARTLRERPELAQRLKKLRERIADALEEFEEWTHYCHRAPRVTKVTNEVRRSIEKSQEAKRRTR